MIILYFQSHCISDEITSNVPIVRYTYVQWVVLVSIAF